ncbi:hypothetical protein LguiA_016050 [Lonicera macranthoides]
MDWIGYVGPLFFGIGLKNRPRPDKFKRFDFGGSNRDEQNEIDDEFIVHGETTNNKPNQHNHSPILDEDEDVEALERTIYERYVNSINTEFEEETTAIDQQTLLSSVRDPMVKCATGHEREIATKLMLKSMDKKLGLLKIRIAISLDHLESYMYVEVEANKEAQGHLESYVYVEVEDEANKEDHVIWVMMKVEVYKGDLAKVVGVDNVRRLS